MKSPFKFLDSYTKDDREIFFGREREIEELYHRVFESKILLVYGVSGTGKSSLIHCGLANKFQETDWLPLNIRRGSNIIDSFASVIKSSSITPLTSEISTPGQFKKAVRSLYLDHYKPVFFIFDQFEELFIFGNKEEKKAVVQVIKVLVESEIQCRFIFVMREEYMAGITEFEKVIPTIFANRVRIEKMSHLNAIEAIKGPCKVENIDLEDGFAEALLEKLSPEGTDVELTYLQVFLDRILRLATRELPPPQGGQGGLTLKAREVQNIAFTLSLLSHVGNVSDLLGRFLEEQIKELDEPETGLTILKSLVSTKGTKKQLTEEEISNCSRTLGKDISPGIITEYLQKFVNLRIVRDKDDYNRFELRHDSLATKIYEKITLVEKELMEVRSFIENEYENYKKRKVLLNEKDLVYISRYEKSLFLNSELKEYIKKSQDVSASKVRAFRVITTIASVVFLLILLGVISYSLRNNKETRSKNLAVQSLLMKNDYPKNGWKIAMEAYKIKKTPIVIKALFEAFYSLWNKKELTDSLGNKFYPQKEVFDFTECRSDIISARFSPDGELIFGYLADNSVKIWNKKGMEIKSFTDFKSPIISLKFSDNKNLIGVLGKDSTIQVKNLEGTSLLKVKSYYNRINPENVFNFSPDGKFIACIVPDKKINIYSSSGKSLQTLSGYPEQTICVNFSPDNRFIVTSSVDSTVIVWYFNKNQNAFSEYTRLTGHKNAVWSVCFSKNSDYVLSASADSSCKIWNLNNEIVWDRNVASYHNIVNATKTRFCNATFSANDNVIIFTQYRIENKLNSSTGQDSDKEVLPVFDQGCRISAESIYYEGGSELFYDHWLEMLKSNKDRKPIFSRIEFNDSTQYVAFTFSDDPQNIYYSGTKEIFKIFSFEGRIQQFSTDGNYLLVSQNKKLILYPANEKELIRLTEQKKIFGGLSNTSKYLENWFKISQ
jgi:WD40 repeat protein